MAILAHACATHGLERQDRSLRNNRGCARQICTAAMLEEIAQLTMAR